MPAKVPQTEQKPAPRKVVLVLTDDEWRQVRVNAASNDTTIQGYLTDVVLSELQRDGLAERD